MTRRILQLYRGTSAQNDAFTGAAGELTMDTTNNQLRLHDGTTQGGHVIGSGGGGGHQVVEFQAPTAENNYTWYRKYADGWVEQGGQFTQSANSAIEPSLTFPIELADNNYMVVWSAGASGLTAGSYFAHQVNQSTKTITGCQVKTGNNNTNFTVLNWYVCYMAA